MQRIIVQCEQKLTKVALMEEQHLVEFYMERPLKKQQIGNIYKGRVVNVLPGMQAAFVDIGLEKNAFLYIDDLLPAHLDKQPVMKPSINQLVHVGKELLVQISKEAHGTKGARVTTHFSLPGRWVVYMPFAGYIGISRKIASEIERERLKMLAEELRHPEEGLIVRTVAEGESDQAIAEDITFLRDLWTEVQALSLQCDVPSQIYRDLDLIPRLIRDIFTSEVDEMIIDDEQQALEVIRMLQHKSPELADKIKIHRDPVPIDQFYGLDQEMESSFRRKVWLKSGSYIVIDHTEALTIIDVNTGKFVGSVDLEQTAFDTNLEAAQEIARLLRIRDIGGIIIVDFIDMNQGEHRQAVRECLEHFLQRDRTKCLVEGWTKLGLLEITRKKVREDIDTLFFDNCTVCHGSGKVYSPQHPLYRA